MKSNIKKLILPLTVLLIFVSAPLYDNFSKKYIDNSLKESIIIYGTVRATNAFVSILKHSSVSAGIGVDVNIGIGEILDPIDDALERFSDMITISLWTLAAEKAIYEISKLSIVYIFILTLGILYYYYESEFIKGILIILIVLRLFIPFSAISSNYIDKKIFSPKIEKYTKILKNNSDQNITFSSLKEKISLSYLKKYSVNTLSALINLSMVYFAKYVFNLILLPFLFILIIKNIPSSRQLWQEKK